MHLYSPSHSKPCKIITNQKTTILKNIESTFESIKSQITEPQSFGISEVWDHIQSDP